MKSSRMSSTSSAYTERGRKCQIVFRFRQPYLPPSQIRLRRKARLLSSQNIPQSVELMSGNDLTKCRKKNRIFASLVWIVHRNELLHRGNKLRPLGLIL